MLTLKDRSYSVTEADCQTVTHPSAGLSASKNSISSTVFLPRGPTAMSEPGTDLR